MYNDLITIGNFTLHSYGLFIAIGIIAAYFTAEYRAKKKGMQHELVFWLVVWCLIFGFAGSKIVFFLTQVPRIIQDPAIFDLLDFLLNGWVVYGGILGGIVGGFLFCRRHKLPAWKWFDLGLASVALAQGFGRIGCFMAGCCYGVITDSPIGIVFPHLDAYPHVPTQLISAILDFLLFFFLILYDKKLKKNDGEGTAWYLILYSVGRFIIEFYRGDTIRGTIGGILSTSQFISFFTLAAGLVILINRRLALTDEEKALLADEDGGEAAEDAEAAGEEAMEEIEAAEEAEAAAEKAAEAAEDSEA